MAVGTMNDRFASPSSVADGPPSARPRPVGRGPSRRLVLSGILAVGCALALAPELHAQNGEEAVAIVVHPETAVEGLSFEQLRSVFLGEQQFWPDRSRITLLMRAPRAHERDVVLDRIYQMDEGSFRQYWIAKIFRAEVPSGPKIVFSTDMTRELVTVIPGSIGFLPLSAEPSGLKVLRIDGKLPGEDGYPLR